MESHEELIRLAQLQTGLQDYGEDTFREGLEILVKSLNTEAKLNAIGESAIRELIMRYLRQRLEIEEWYRLHPETNDLTICDPLFGVSLPRTGSTALSFLLSCDPGVRYLRKWESEQPFPPSATVTGPDPRRGQDIGPLAGQAAATRHTPTGVDGAWECNDLMALNFTSQIFIAYAKIPTYADWLREVDMTSTYQYERRALKMLRWGEPDKPWRLKAPSHLLYIDELAKVFPEARFVMTHRDPAEVMLSVAVVYADLHPIFTDEPDFLHIGEMNIDNWVKGMERLTAFRDKPENDRLFYDIHFRAMQADPVGEVRGLYAWLGEEVTPGFEEGMKSFWEENNEREREQIQKPDPTIFGFDMAAVRDRFSGYLDRMQAWAPYPK